MIKFSKDKVLLLHRLIAEETGGSIGRTQWMPHRAESTQKRRKALRHNAFRRSSYLHTQEVTGSSPAVSTKSHLI